MNSSVIVVVDAGQVAPRPYLEKVLATHNKGLGCVAMFPESKDGLMISKEKGQPNLDKIMKTMEDFKEVRLVFSFVDGDILQEDIPPFDMIRNDKGHSLLVCLPEGDFSPSARADGAHTPEYYACLEYYSPKLTKIANDLGGDMDKLLSELEDSFTQQELASKFKDRGSLVFLAHTDDVKVVETNDLSHTFDWGWVSNTLGYGEQQYPAMVEKQEDLKRRFSSMMASTPAPEVIPPVQKPVDKPVSVPVVPAAKPAATPAVQVVVNEDEWETVMLVPPDTCTSKNDRRAWFKTHNNGIITKDFRAEHPAPISVRRKKLVPPPANVTLSTQPVQAKPAGFKTFNEAAAAIAAPTNEKQVVPEKPALVLVPMLTPDERKGTIAYIGADQIKMMPPDEVYKLEAKFPDIAAQLGIKGGLGEIANWSFETIADLTKVYPNLGAIMTLSFRREWRKLRDMQHAIDIAVNKSKDRIAM